MSENKASDQTASRRSSGLGEKLRTVFLLTFISFLVGAVLVISGISPIDLWKQIGNGIYNLFETIINTGWDTISTILLYIAVGAVVVVPIWAVIKLLKMRR